MATTHVFIVGENTFDFHLKYLFAGTGAKDLVIDFNNNSSTELYHTTENNLVGMIADAQRIRKGDLILFYLQQNGGKFGKFYGVFKAKEHHSFLDNNTKGQYLTKILGKSLTFRTLIEPHEVYSKGVSEWEALDSIEKLNSPNEMIWSLIYRKLKGNRGNTMITHFESEKLINLIRKKNSNTKLRGRSFTFDSDKEVIIKTNNSFNYSGRNTKLIVLPRLLNKFINWQQFEKHLQAYIIELIGLKINRTLDSTLLKGFKVHWLGNEVSCGVGMQSIDILLYTKNGSAYYTIPIELKSVEVFPDITYQLQRYVDWLNQYYIPHHPSKIIPTIISRKIVDKNRNDFQKSVKSFNDFNQRNRVEKLRLIEFSLVKNDLLFEEYLY